MAHVEDRFRRVTSSILAQARQMLGDEMACSVVFSRVSREARRIYGVTKAQEVLRQIVGPLPDVPYNVRVPDLNFRLGQMAQLVWNLIGFVFRQLQIEVGADTALVIILRQVIRDAEAAFGKQETAGILKGLIETLPEAAKYDRQ